MQRSHLGKFHVDIFCVTLLILFCTHASAAATPGLGEIKGILQQQWESLGTVEYVCDEYPERVNGTTIEIKGHMRYEMSQAKGGLTSYRVLNLMEDGDERIILELLEDGKTRHEVSRFPKKPNVVSRLTLSNQVGIDSGLKGVVMSSVLWLTTPGGKPLYDCLDESTEINEVTTGGKRIIEVVISLNDAKLKYQLDTDHDWLPSSAEFLDSERTMWKVDKFQRDNGRWFPAEGILSSTLVGNYNESRFVISGVKINRPIPPERFKPPVIQAGVYVTDKTKGKSYIHGGGGSNARNEFVHRYRSVEQPSPLKENSGVPLKASREPDQKGWAAITAGLSVFLLATAGFMKLIRRKR